MSAAKGTGASVVVGSAFARLALAFATSACCMSRPNCTVDPKRIASDKFFATVNRSASSWILISVYPALIKKSLIRFLMRSNSFGVSRLNDSRLLPRVINARNSVSVSFLRVFSSKPFSSVYFSENFKASRANTLPAAASFSISANKRSCANGSVVSISLIAVCNTS